MGKSIFSFGSKVKLQLNGLAQERRVILRVSRDLEDNSRADLQYEQCSITKHPTASADPNPTTITTESEELWGNLITKPKL